MTYYDTTKLAAGDLAQAEARAKSETELVRRFFEARPGKVYTSWEAHAEMLNAYPEMDGVPKGNIGRTMTVLYNEGFLVQTGDKKKSGPWEKPCLLYRLATPAADIDPLHGLPRRKVVQANLFS